jgi:sterol desaturase/sphingolipid hydroxylase (fatty acid hydroxylase superfamily)
MTLTLTLVVILVAVLAVSGVSMRVLSAVATSDFARRHRRREDRPSRIDGAVHRRSRIVNSVVSTGLLFGVTVPLASRLFVAGPASALRTVGEAAAILALYDFAYYLLHRFGFHQWSVGRRIHSVHHAVRTPYTADSLYIHPLETVAGVGVFLVCAALVGPVGLWSFGLAFLVYSLLNLFVHSGIDLRFFPFRTLTALVRHHDIHHESMKSGYYASITPLWDVVFRTARPGRSP